jgi:EpsI family protein
MSRFGRVVLCGIVLTSGLMAQAALERANRTERPLLRRPLETVPLQLGDWVGHDEKMRDDVVERAQTTEYLNRIYENTKTGGPKLQLWMNYSVVGTNLRHTPAICLPSSGWALIESQTREIEIGGEGEKPIKATRLSYSRGELVEHVGFWYYIFGEGTLENYVRQLSITSRSSHGQTTRGSSMTVEVIYLGDRDPDGETLKGFARELVRVLEPILPQQRAVYYVP